LSVVYIVVLMMHGHTDIKNFQVSAPWNLNLNSFPL